jgi:two-component system, sensor histidine kinase and response regulator
VESIPLPCWIFQPGTDRLLEVNELAIGLYGFSRAEFLSMSYSSLCKKNEDTRTDINRDVARHRTGTGGDLFMILIPRKLDGDVELVMALDVTEKRRLIESVQAREEQFRKLVDGSADIIYEADANGYFTFVNAAARTILGLEPDSLIGRHYTDLIRPDWRDRVREFYKLNTAATGVPTYFEFPTVGTGGRIFWIGQSVTPILDNGILRFQAIARDVTERRIAEERFHTFMNNSPTIAFMKDTAGRYVYANELLNRHFAKSGASVLGQTDEELLPADVLPPIEQSDEAVLRTGRPAQLLSTIPTVDGEVRHWLTYKFPVAAADGATYVGGVAVDLTERITLERDLATARDAALVSARLKSEFLANMSHEIRTPMNGVLGLLGLLLDSNLDADQRDLASTARSSAESLLTIINDVLDFSKIEAGKLDFEILDFDVRSTCESTMEILADAARQKSLELAYVVDPEIPSILRGDAGRLRQVLVNLVSNAIKFTEKGGVLVQIERDQVSEESVTLRFRITDTGIGISAETKERLFQPFTQGDPSTTRKFGGTGLGLTISKHLVRLMEGEIGVDSEPGCGSSFWFTARLGCSDGTAPENKASSMPRVLVIDDSTTTRQMISLQLTAWGTPNENADDSLTALAMLRAAHAAGTPYDLVIADLNMPQVDGLSLTRMVRGTPQFGNPRIVLVTASAQLIDAATMSGLGISTCIRKPVKQDHLHAAVFGTAASRARTVIAPGAGLSSAKRTTGRRILIVEDNAVNQKVALRQIQKLGFAAEVVGNGLEALEALQRIAYDLVLMDCQMPEMDGYEATTEIRRREEPLGKHTPVIALTASASGSDRDRCVEAGMDDFLSKPVRESALAEIVERWLPAISLQETT